MQRRKFLTGSAAMLTGLSVGSVISGTVARAATTATPNSHTDTPPVNPAQWANIDESLAPIKASTDRIITMDVCTRPFRAQGPRLEAERIGRKTVIHNYGHGGSGWSLSWGTGTVATELAKATKEKEIAVVGCGAVGLTTALVAQQHGLKVRIYTKERPPYVRSALATGIWSPDSRICTLEHAPAFAERWEKMVRISFKKFQTLLGLPANPVEWRDIYTLSDYPFDHPRDHYENNVRTEPEYPKFQEHLIADIEPKSHDLAPGSHPFPVSYVRRKPLMIFNISAYAKMMLDEFLLGGGEIVDYELKDAGDFAKIKEKTIINATGYGARALLKDDSVIPVRGQTAKLIPQPEVTYGIRYIDKKISVTPRRDGLLVQTGNPTDFNNPDTTLDYAESEGVIQRLAELYKSIPAKA